MSRSRGPRVQETQQDLQQLNEVHLLRAEQPLKEEHQRQHTKLKKSSGRLEKKVRMFKIGFVDKEEHPQALDIPAGQPAISVNGTVGGRLKLRKGYTYYFNVKSNPQFPGARFYLTLDAKGGKEDQREHVGGTAAISSGAFNLEINDSLPATFYYHLKDAPFAGGVCVVDDVSSD